MANAHSIPEEENLMKGISAALMSFSLLIVAIFCSLLFEFKARGELGYIPWFVLSLPIFGMAYLTRRLYRRPTPAEAEVFSTVFGLRKALCYKRARIVCAAAVVIATGGIFSIIWILHSDRYVYYYLFSMFSLLVLGWVINAYIELDWYRIVRGADQK